MEPALKKTIEDLGRDFEDFKKNLNDQVAAIQTKGHADPLLMEKVNKMADAIATMDGHKADLEKQQGLIDAMKTRTDELEARLNAPVTDGEKNADPLTKEIREKTIEYFRKGRRDACDFVNDKLADRAKSLNMTINQEGEVFYSVTRDSDIQPLVEEISPLHQECTVINISGHEYRGLMETGGIESGWVGERETRDDTDGPTFGELAIPVHDIYAMPEATTVLLEDAEYDIEGHLNNGFARSFAKKGNAAFVAGDGVKKPRGFLSYPTSATPTGRQVKHLASGGSGAWAADPHTILLGSPELLKADYRANAKWMMARTMKAEIMKMVDGNKLPIWQPSFQAGTPSTLLGFPLIDCEDMPAKASNSLSIAFGDFKRAYKIIVRRGITVLRDPFTKKGVVKFYATARMGGDVADTEAFFVIKFASA